MSAFFGHHKHNSGADSHSQTNRIGFHDGYVYKIINRADENVIQVQWGNAGTEQCKLVTDEDMDSENQRFRAVRMKEGERGGQFQVHSVVQKPHNPVQIWDILPHFKNLTQNEAHSNGCHLWYCEEKDEGSRLYYIKTTSSNACLTNMGDGEPIALLPVDVSEYGLRQLWVLEPTDYNL